MFAVKWWKGVMRVGFPNLEKVVSRFDSLSHGKQHLVAFNNVSQ